MGIVRFALRFQYTFYVLAALILFLGVVAMRATPTDIFPEIRIPVVSVIWSYTGLSTPEMEQRVTTYSQYSISANVNGIKNIEAQSEDQRGLVHVTIEVTDLKHLEKTVGSIKKIKGITEITWQ